MILFLHGPDTFSSKEKLRALKEKFIRDVDPSGININHMKGEGFDIELFRTEVLSTPFLVQKRLIIVESLSQNTKKEIFLQVADVLKNIKNSVIIIFRENELSAVQKKNPLYSILFKEKYIFTFPLLEGLRLQKWYDDQITKLGANAKPEVLRFLTSSIGNDLWRAKNEIDKIRAYCHGREITLEDIKLFVAEGLDDNIFSFTDALGQKNKKAALELLSHLIQNGMSEVEILNKIIWHYKNLILIKSFYSNDAQAPSWKAAQELGIHPFVAKKVATQSRNFSLLEMKATYKKFVQIDQSIKTSQATKGVLLDLLIANVKK